MDNLTVYQGGRHEGGRRLHAGEVLHEDGRVLCIDMGQYCLKRLWFCVVYEKGCVVHNHVYNLRFTVIRQDSYQNRGLLGLLWSTADKKEKEPRLENAQPPTSLAYGRADLERLAIFVTSHGRDQVTFLFYDVPKRFFMHQCSGVVQSQKKLYDGPACHQIEEERPLQKHYFVIVTIIGL